MRDLSRRLEKLEAQVGSGACICGPKLVIRSGEPIPQVTPCPVHPQADRLIIIERVFVSSPMRREDQCAS